MTTTDTPLQDTPSRSLHERLGGDATFDAIAERFYTRMERHKRYARLRALHQQDLDTLRASLAGFLIGWAGGSRRWFDANPGRCMMSMHAGMAIDPELGGQWAECMEHAIREVLPDPVGDRVNGMALTFDIDARDTMIDALTRTAHALGRANLYR